MGANNLQIPIATMKKQPFHSRAYVQGLKCASTHLWAMARDNTY